MTKAELIKAVIDHVYLAGSITIFGKLYKGGLGNIDTPGNLLEVTLGGTIISFGVSGSIKVL